MSSIGERIEIALIQKGKSKSWLADKIGLSKQALHYIITQASRPKYVTEIAVALNISSDWLSTGEGQLEFFDSLGVGKKIALLDPTNVVHYLSETSVSDYDRYVTVDSLETEDTFAFLLDNRSMEPLFCIGATLLFRANKLPNDGEFVLCSLRRNNEIVFRQYFRDGSGTYLKPLNEIYRSIMDEPFNLLGTLVESRMRYS